MRFTLNNLQSIKRSCTEVQKEKEKILNKSEMFVDRLINVGISVAKVHTGEYAGYIIFSKGIEKHENGVEGMMLATNGNRLIKSWYTNKEMTEKRSYEVSPILLAEFGSGWFANNIVWDVEGVGQGTMPDSYGHANDPAGWYWYDESGKKHHSYGAPPSFPMHNAMMAMMADIDRIARSVFNG